MKILHFSDAHIGAANHGRRDPQTDLPLRVMDFLASLDTIIDTAVTEKVDLVLFSGDAYDNRNPTPTMQREWSRRIMRLSKAGIPAMLLVGNHDLSPALNRAHALDSFSTLDVPRVIVADRPRLYKPEDLFGLPLQIIAIPWIPRSSLVAQFNLSVADPGLIYEKLEGNLADLLEEWLGECDPSLPVILTAHTSIQGAEYGAYRTVVLGSELTLSPALVKNPRFNYVALGHIHKAQDLNEGNQPPLVYPGSIERVDFGEAGETKHFVIAHVTQGQPTQVEWRDLITRPFILRLVKPDSAQNLMSDLLQALEPRAALKDAMVRLTIDYPREWETMIDESALRAAAAEAFEFHVIRYPRQETRLRLPEDRTIGSLSPRELLDIYLRSLHTQDDDIKPLEEMAESIFQEDVDAAPSGE